jgi:hypothetical protein
MKKRPLLIIISLIIAIIGCEKEKQEHDDQQPNFVVGVLTGNDSIKLISGTISNSSIFYNNLYIPGKVPVSAPRNFLISAKDSVSYTWKFHNGYTTTDSMVTVQYDTVGSYSVTVFLQKGMLRDTLNRTVIVVNQ